MRPFYRSLLALLFLMQSVATLRAQDQRTVTEPVFPSVCTTLTAALSITNGEPSSETAFDTTRIQSALNLSTCVGKAVQLSAANGNYAFLTKPLTIPTGVTLLIDPGVTLFASRNPADYQKGTVGGNQLQCGVDYNNGISPNGCYPLITTTGSGTSGSGIMGYGVINGRGGDALLNSSGTPLTNPYATTTPSCAVFSWYCLTTQTYTPGTNTSIGLQNNPMLIEPVKASNFTMYKVSLINAPYFQVRYIGPATGLTIWGLKIVSPYNYPNTDGIDPVDGSSNITIANSFISNGDDNIAFSANNTSTTVSNASVYNVYTYAGDGMSIGTGLVGGASNIVFSNIYQSAEVGAAAGGQTGIKLKSTGANGGLVNNITYKGFCMRNQPQPIHVNAFEGSTTSTTSIPTFSNIQFQNISVLASTVSTNLELRGYDANHLSTLTFDNLSFATAPTVSGPEYTTINVGPGPVPSILTTVTGPGVAHTGSVTNPTEAPFPCSASSFPALVGELYASTPTLNNQQSLTATYPINLTLNAVIEPPTAESPALTQSIVFYDGATAIGTVTRIGNGTYAPLSLTSATPGTHTYSAQYPADSNYAAYSFGSVTVTVPVPVTVTATPTPFALNPGASGMATVTITPAAGYTGSVAIACSSPVTYLTCSVTTPAPITGTAATTGTATITLAASISQFSQPATPRSNTSRIAAAALLPLAALLLLPVVRKRRALPWTLATLLAFAVLSATLTGCGGSSSGSGTTTPTPTPPPAGNVTLTFTTTTGGYSTTNSFVVTVN